MTEYTNPPRRMYQVRWADGTIQLVEGNILSSPSDIQDVFSVKPGRWKITRIEGKCWNTVFAANDELIASVVEIEDPARTETP